MTSRVIRRALVAAAALGAVLSSFAAAIPAASAAGLPIPQSPSTPPSVSLDLQEVAAGSTVGVTVRNFAATVLTIQVCGNEGRRGSVDCNVADALTVEVPEGRSSLTARFTMTRPPAPCPCIVQVSSERFDETAVAAFTLIGHPIGDVVDTGNGAAPLQVSVIAERADSGGLLAAVRSSLGGETEYDVTVIVKNTTNAVVKGVALSVAAGRGSDDEIITVPFPEIAELAPKQVWRQTTRATLPSPVLGSVVWRATSTAYALSSTASDSTRNQPVLLWVATAVFSLCVLALVVRLVIRLFRRGRRRTRARRQSQGAALAAI